MAAPLVPAAHMATVPAVASELQVPAAHVQAPRIQAQLAVVPRMLDRRAQSAVVQRIPPAQLEVAAHTLVAAHALGAA